MADLTLSTADLVNAARGLDLITLVEITPKGAYALRRARRAVAGAMASYDEQRLALAAKHSHTGEDGQPRKKVIEVDGKPVEMFDLADRAAFDADLAAILSESVTLAGVRAVTLVELGDAKVSEAALSLLGPLVVEPDEA